MNQFYKNLALWLVVGLVMLALYNIFNQPHTTIKELSFTEFMDSVDHGQVADITIQGDMGRGKFSDGKLFQVYLMNYPELFKELRAANVKVTARPAESTPWYMSVLISWFPMVLLIAIWIFFMRQMQNGGSRALSFGKSKARMITDSSKKATFKDVAGIEEAKEDLQEIIDFLKDPRKFQKLGGKIPKGVLLMGPPGTGKTLLARAIAGEANVPFFSISGSDFVEMFVGVGASRVRDLFEQAKKSAPCIIFVDEIDAVGRHRGAGLGGGHDEREQTLNQLLVEMDGFEGNEGAIVIAATNRPDVLDPALLRPGRFDRQVVVPRPDVGGREAILKVHVSKIPMDNDVDVKVLARGTPGFTGADLQNLCNEAALLAARVDADKVSMRHFETAKDKVMMGAERRSMIISEKEKKNTAVHEAGHALVALMLPGTDPIHKVSIIPRGRALGVTQQLPVDEKHTHPRNYLTSRLAILMGGRAAEETVLDQFTTGASNDIEQATNLARKMVCEWGMSEKLGPVAFGQREEQIFLGREIAQHRDFSEHTAIEIDDEVRGFVTHAYEIAKGLLIEHRDILNTITDALLEVEVVDGAEIAEMVRKGLAAKGIEMPAPQQPSGGDGRPRHVVATAPADVAPAAPPA
ncbi:MAG: ATP-dependent metallopeptidase FtsH/Yme1/Tma family protein [Nitrospinae bacterium]|nr:ATP-dependent metallopeptidase FtsH/Yme1/Tma family protein [Nitrospinota bacterium]